SLTIQGNTLIIRPWDWGVGLRGGTTFLDGLGRLTAGLDYEWGKQSSHQITASLGLDWRIADSPFTVGLLGEAFRRRDALGRSDTDYRALATLSADLAGRAHGFGPRARPETRWRIASLNEPLAHKRTVDVYTQRISAPGAPPVQPPSGSADMTVAISLPASMTVGTAVTGSITCRNGGTVAATNATCSASGLPTGLTLGTCSPATPVASLAAGQSISCPISGTPSAAGSFTLSATTSAANDTNTANNTVSQAITVSTPAPSGSADMTVAISLPASMTVGTAVTGSITCRNAGTIAATSATCSASGLPTGLTLGACSPATPVASLGAGQSITCPVSGTPAAAGSFTVTATSSATNDANSANNTASQAITVSPAPPSGNADMSVSISLPATMTVGTAVTGSISCSNVGTIAATSATCSASGLPTGLTLGACSPATPVASLGAGQLITCPVSGTPSAAGSFTVTATTSAANDTNTANNTSTQVITVSGGTTGANRPPNAVNDSVSVSCTAGATTDFNVLTNDSDPDGDTIFIVSFTALTPNSLGSISFIGAGSFRFTAAGGGTSGTFTYTITDTRSAFATATVTLTCR
ncbi:MAG: Ig-like domain-containing protein, partial [Casimicrobiaceae bacterium]|nr:Ig-like domain-containing protein [Casimicrobiaceae bacterium]